MTKTKHRGAKNGVPGVVFVSGECECSNCQGWLWSRHLVEGTRLEPYLLCSVPREEWVEIADEQYNAAVEWGRKYGGLKQRCNA